MKKKKQSEYERFMALSDAEKDAEVAKYENGVDESEFRELTPAERKRWEKWQKKAKANFRKAGRPVIGKGAKVISLSVERELLAQADRYAKAHKLKRTEMVAQGLRLVMAS